MLLRLATRDDARLLLDWRNDAATRAASHRPAAVSLEEHMAWLDALLRDSTRILWIAEDDGAPAGTVRAEARFGDEWELSWTVAPAMRGRGAGTRMVQLAIEAFPGATLRAQVRRENAASLAIATRCGFTLESESDGILHFLRKERGRDAAG